MNQVSDVAHGPLVSFCFASFEYSKTYQTAMEKKNKEEKRKQNLCRYS
jgi:hypothetical protein